MTRNEKKAEEKSRRLTVGKATIVSVLFFAVISAVSGQAASPSIVSTAGSLNKGILIGSTNAPVTIEEYTDFLCSACAQFSAAILPKLEDDYIRTGKVKMVIYVISPHQLGWAALCAEEQGKFGELSHYFFTHQKEISRERDIRPLAISAGVDIKKFDACYASRRHQERVDSWIKEAEKRKVFSIPAFFINGEKLVGARPYAEFKKIIDQKLEAR